MSLEEILQIYGLFEYARKAWRKKAMLRTWSGSTVIVVGKASFPFAYSFEDVIASDWVVVSKRSPNAF